MNISKRCLTALCLSIAVFLSGCGGGSGGDDQPAEGSGSIAEGFGSAAEDPGSTTESEGVQYLAPGMSSSGQLAQGDTQVYRVDSGTNISLISTSGNADVFLFDNFNQIDVNELANADILENDLLLCWSAFPFQEDVCSASVTDGEMFALVHGREDSIYSITAVNDCSTEVINEWAYRGLKDFYFYADQVAVVDPSGYADTQDMIEDLRFEQSDPFSGIRDRATQTAFFDEGVQFGLGHSWRRDNENNLRIAYVFTDSPFGRAGIKRGDIAVSLGGEPLDQTMTSERFTELAGTQDNPVVSNWVFVDGDTGLSKSISVRIGEYALNTVLYSTHFAAPGFSGRIGYIVLSNFIEPSREELDRVIENFNQVGVSELILDLRYNGGGRSFVSRRLASQIGGSRVQGMTFARFEYNRTYSGLDFEENFPTALPVLGIDRLVVLTTDSTASASESLINTLRPYMEVITIGERSVGKAFRSYGRSFCDKTLNLMQVRGVNANNGSVVDGIPADCYAADDMTRNFGNESGSVEAMLGKGIDYLVDGNCDSSPAMARHSQKMPVIPTHEMLFVGSDDGVN